MRPRRLLVALLACATGAVAGCGVPVDDQPLLDDPASVPFGLLDAASPAPDEPRESEAPEPPPGRAVEIYLVSADNRLVAAERTIDDPSSFAALLAVLGEGPTAAETEAGLRSALPGPALMRFGELTGGVATVDLAEEIQAIDGPNQLLAIAQVVFTLTSRPGVGRVVFTLEGGPVEVPRGDGSLTSGSVSRDSYRELVDAGAGTPGTSTTTAP